VKINRYAGLLILLVALQASCGVQQIRDAAQRAVDKFHNQLNAGQFHEIYVESDEGFRKAATEQDVVALFDAVRRKLGTIKEAKQTGWHVNRATGGTVITVGYDVQFSEGKAVEQFVFRFSGDKATLFNYNINSPLLVTK
jgi:hypothetical protein